MSDPYTDEYHMYLKKETKAFEKLQRRYSQHVNGRKKKKYRKNPTRDEFSKRMKRCKYCKATENLTVDHKVPLSLGGKDVESNWQCLCKMCNQYKSSYTEKQIKSFFKWFLSIQQSRVEHGKKPYTLR